MSSKKNLLILFSFVCFFFGRTFIIMYLHKPICVSLKIQSNLAPSILKISHRLLHPSSIIYVIVMAALILLNSQSQQNPADTAYAVSNSQDPPFTSKPFENTNP